MLCINFDKNDRATFWAIFSQTHLVHLLFDNVASYVISEVHTYLLDRYIHTCCPYLLQSSVSIPLVEGT
jgi:hypothetical protein